MRDWVIWQSTIIQIEMSCLALLFLSGLWIISNLLKVMAYPLYEEFLSWSNLNYKAPWYEARSNVQKDTNQLFGVE